MFILGLLTMRLGVVALLLLFFCAPLTAQEIGNDRPTWNPPARFDKPYEGQLIEHRLPQQAVRRYCAQLFAHYGMNIVSTMHQRGCAIRQPGYCVIAYIDRMHGLATPESVRRHEIGHCNGWPANHPE